MILIEYYQIESKRSLHMGELISPNHQAGCYKVDSSILFDFQEIEDLDAIFNSTPVVTQVNSTVNQKFLDDICLDPIVNFHSEEKTLNSQGVDDRIDQFFSQKCDIDEEKYDRRDSNISPYIRPADPVSENLDPCNLITKSDSRKSLPKKAKDAMVCWLLKNLKYPYPTREQKLKWSVKFNISVKSITRFFINQRVRGAL